jgi:hypothetical protein
MEDHQPHIQFNCKHIHVCHNNAGEHLNLYQKLSWIQLALWICSLIFFFLFLQPLHDSQAHNTEGHNRRGTGKLHIYTWEMEHKSGSRCATHLHWVFGSAWFFLLWTAKYFQHSHKQHNIHSFRFPLYLSAQPLAILGMGGSIAFFYYFSGRI